MCEAPAPREHASEGDGGLAPLQRRVRRLAAEGSSPSAELTRPPACACLTAMVIVVMGVSGAGKTTVGQRLAAALGARFVDADEFHTPANLARMAAGVPLDEADRAPWLHALAAAIDGWLQQTGDVVLACSALRASHRQALRRHPSRVVFAYLQVPADVARDRLLARRDHFFKADMLGSQLETLEPPDDALTVDASQPVDTIVAELVAHLAARRTT
ncbi:gluconokinase [Nannocystis pusilla]|uniref:Gluconokinase n=1 Tax=Nannocystis pusilla TaxID=889268 RepID=A0ABS7U5T3_9BACT|nr:gluconokinase [Nannocystis pusilla]MBZ5715919.1 AAA family ATPase [Nannocystis pusilla]